MTGHSRNVKLWLGLCYLAIVSKCPRCEIESDVESQQSRRQVCRDKHLDVRRQVYKEKAGDVKKTGL